MNPAFPDHSSLNTVRKGGVKIIILYASAGAGHYKAAKAIYDYFKKREPSLEIKLIDALDYSTAFFKNSYAKIYNLIIHHIPWLWGLIYYLTYVKHPRNFINVIRLIVNRMNTKELERFLTEENPDFVISTHFLPSQVTAHLKSTKRINAKLISVITDFSVHPFWLSKNTDLYVVASASTKGELIREGINAENVKVSGIPVAEKFMAKLDRNALSKNLGFAGNEFTVLIMTGSFGIGPIEKIVDLLCQNVQIIVVCAKNKILLSRLKNKNCSKVRAFGFVNNIEELMSISDIIITKPGGLTISELLSRDLVPIFISAIPGQETENIRILNHYGIGITVDNVKEIKNIVLDYKAHPDKLEIIKGRMRTIKKPYPLEELYYAVCQDSVGPAS